jgi:hypothetical protein
MDFLGSLLTNWIKLMKMKLVEDCFHTNKTNYKGIKISTDVNNDINGGLVVMVVGDEL